MFVFFKQKTAYEVHISDWSSDVCSSDLTGAKAAPSRMRPKYASSLALLQDTYNNPDMPESVRMRAAEQALPYEHARMGEHGKKEKAKERAKEIAGGSKRDKFAPKLPPPTMQ